MTFEDLQSMFNRACSFCFNLKKILFAFCLLGLCGLVVILFRAFSLHASCWMGICFLFLPLFLSASLLLAGGIPLVRMYHDEIKKRESSWKDIFKRSWELMLTASYFSVPLILAYLLLWMGGGIFALLNRIPYIGSFLSIVLAFGPYLIYFCSLVLIFLGIFMIFLLPPILALRGSDRYQVVKIISEKISRDLFSLLVCFIIALAPIALISVFLWMSSILSSWMIMPFTHDLEIVLYGFFMMIPTAFLLAPGLVFFFNYATEAHVYAMKNLLKASKD